MYRSFARLRVLLGDAHVACFGQVRSLWWLVAHHSPPMRRTLRYERQQTPLFVLCLAVQGLQLSCQLRRVSRLAQSMANHIELYMLHNLRFLVTFSLIEASSDQSCVRCILRSRVRARAETGNWPSCVPSATGRPFKWTASTHLIRSA